MVSTKIIDNTIPAIEAKLKSFSGDMVRIEYLENCLKQIGLQNDVARFCHLKLSDLYAYRLMWGLAAKQMDNAADKATNFRDKIDFYLKEIGYLIRANDFLSIDKAFKKAILCGNNQEKELIKQKFKLAMMQRAQEFEQKNQRVNAALLYERLLENHQLINETERRQLMAKTAELYSKAGKLREAIRYEQMLKKPLPPIKKDPETDVKKVSWEDLGIDLY